MKQAAKLTWTSPPNGDPPTEGAERFFEDLRLLRAERVLWIWFAEHSPVAFSFGDITSLFDESADAIGGTTRLLASPPTSYLLFGEGELGLGDVTAGEYRATWIDFAAGAVALETLSLDGGDETFVAPKPGPIGLALQRVGL